MAFLFTLFVTFFCLGSALVLGGTAAVAFAAAPQLHRTLPARQAGAAFENVLRTFDRLGFGGAWVAMLCAAFLAILSDVGSTRWWIEAGLMGAASAAYLFLLLRLGPRARGLAPPREEDAVDERSDAEQAAFQRMHRTYVRLYAANLFLATCAFVVLALPF